MNLIEQSVQQIRKENLKNYYDTEQAEDELFNMLQSNRLYMMKDRTLDFIKQISGVMVFEGFKKVEEPTSYRIKSESADTSPQGH